MTTLGVGLVRTVVEFGLHALWTTVGGTSLGAVRAGRAGRAGRAADWG
ncbi:MAG: hypothetical protein KKF42_00375 [Actinobacteria bacterium]|nr:hypothetical protein [Actinomycetota bacterium]